MFTVNGIASHSIITVPKMQRWKQGLLSSFASQASDILPYCQHMARVPQGLQGTLTMSGFRLTFDFFISLMTPVCRIEGSVHEQVSCVVSSRRDDDFRCH